MVNRMLESLAKKHHEGRYVRRVRIDEDFVEQSKGAAHFSQDSLNAHVPRAAGARGRQPIKEGLKVCGCRKVG